MLSSLLQLLRCPFCGGTLQPQGCPRTFGIPEYSILSCHCGRYPVVAGIPILRKGVIAPTRQTADQVINLIEAGRSREALLSLLMPPLPNPAALAPKWMQAWPSVRGIGRLKTLMGQPALRAWRARAVAFLTQLGAHVTACDLFDFHFRSSPLAKSDPYNYYAFCFGLPRHLVALSLSSLILNPVKPILDLACGCGHITRHLLPRAQDQPVIGVDRDFFSLYIAKGWMAPQAEYVCSEADISLPFPDATFSTVFCANAFQLFKHKVSCMRELKRLTQETGLIVLVAVRNVLVKQHLYRNATHWALPPAGYEALVKDMPHRLLSNTAILSRYLRKQGPPLASSTHISRLLEEQWLSVVASHRTELFQDYGCFKDWPHAEGHLALNPLYREEGRDASGAVQLRHMLLSPWFEQENGEYRQYQPEIVSLDPQVLNDVAQGQHTAEVERLLAQCVVVGLPAQFR
jgi:ubiquinone/menaquinone biosynthesis C-methylase UbiE